MLSMLRTAKIGVVASSVAFVTHQTFCADEALKANLKAEIKKHIINKKANACPMAMRIAWHSAGTFDKSDGSGGTNGGTMRFEPERSDGANNGLHIIHDMLLPIKKKYPQVSYGDLWALAGSVAVEFAGGPTIPFEMGRIDVTDAEVSKGSKNTSANGGRCPVVAIPPNGRLPDASQGAEHLRQVFGRMGFSDREIVALSGGHTLGRCHSVRSGFDGPWTKNILKFNNDYFKNLMFQDWKPRQWSGPIQYSNEDNSLMMLPTDIAIKTDPIFNKIALEYANNQNKFFEDFKLAYAKLMCLGCPSAAIPKEVKNMVDQTGGQKDMSLLFREHVMHGSFERAQQCVGNGANVHEVEVGSARSALHKAAFWNHTHIVPWLLNDCHLDPNLLDYNGDTALHDVARFGHVEMAKMILKKGADLSIKNNEGKTPLDLATQYEKTELVKLFQNAVPTSTSSFEDKWKLATVPSAK